MCFLINHSMLVSPAPRGMLYLWERRCMRNGPTAHAISKQAVFVIESRRLNYSKIAGGEGFSKVSHCASSVKSLKSGTTQQAQARRKGLTKETSLMQHPCRYLTSVLTKVTIIILVRYFSWAEAWVIESNIVLTVNILKSLMWGPEIICVLNCASRE